MIHTAEDTNKTITEETAVQMSWDAMKAATFEGQLIAPFTFQLIAGRLSIIFNSFTNLVTISDDVDNLLMVAKITDSGIEDFSWVQAGWSWRRALKAALK